MIFIKRFDSIAHFRSNGGQWQSCPNLINKHQCVWRSAEDNVVISSGIKWTYIFLIRHMKVNKTLTYGPLAPKIKVQEEIGTCTGIYNPQHSPVIQ